MDEATHTERLSIVNGHNIRVVLNATKHDGMLLYYRWWLWCRVYFAYTSLLPGLVVVAGVVQLGCDIGKGSADSHQ